MGFAAVVSGETVAREAALLLPKHGTDFLAEGD